MSDSPETEQTRVTLKTEKKESSILICGDHRTERTLPTLMSAIKDAGVLIDADPEFKPIRDGLIAVNPAARIEGKLISEILISPQNPPIILDAITDFGSQPSFETQERKTLANRPPSRGAKFPLLAIMAAMGIPFDFGPRGNPRHQDGYQKTQEDLERIEAAQKRREEKAAKRKKQHG